MSATKSKMPLNVSSSIDSCTLSYAVNKQTQHFPNYHGRSQTDRQTDTHTDRHNNALTISHDSNDKIQHDDTDDYQVEDPQAKHEDTGVVVLHIEVRQHQSEGH